MNIFRNVFLLSCFCLCPSCCFPGKLVIALWFQGSTWPIEQTCTATTVYPHIMWCTCLYKIHRKKEICIRAAELTSNHQSSFCLSPPYCLTGKLLIALDQLNKHAQPWLCIPHVMWCTGLKSKLGKKMRMCCWWVN